MTAEVLMWGNLQRNIFPGFPGTYLCQTVNYGICDNILSVRKDIQLVRIGENFHVIV